MRTILTVALGALAVSAACFAVGAIIPNQDEGLSLPFLDVLNLGSGKPACRGERKDRQVITRNFAWDGQDTVAIRVPSVVRYRRGTGDSVSVRARTWVLDHVLVDDGRIEFDCRNMRNWGSMEITLPGVPMRSFALSGAGEMYLENIQQEELKIAMSGAGSIRADGHADSANVSIAGIGKVDMGRLPTRRLGLRIAGSGDVDVAPQDSADISIAGTGRVRLLTEPKELSTHIAGTGRVLHGPK